MILPNPQDLLLALLICVAIVCLVLGTVAFIAQIIDDYRRRKNHATS